MLDYEIMRLIWWALLGVLLIGFAVMDGFDLGVGDAAPFVAPHRYRTPHRHQYRSARSGKAIRSGSFWAAARSSPRGRSLYATAFSGFYLAMFLVLAALILRPGGFQVPQQDR